MYNPPYGELKEHVAFSGWKLVGGWLIVDANY